MPLSLRLPFAVRRPRPDIVHIHSPFPLGEFANWLWGCGAATVVKLTPEERSTAVRAAGKMGLNVAGVDLLRSNHGPVVMEVNSSPGLEGIEHATGKDVAGLIIQFIDNNARPNRTRTRGKG